MPDPPFIVVPVFFATDRALALSESLSFGQFPTYGPARNQQGGLEYGAVDVSIPRYAHERGRVERPTIWTLWRENREQHFTIVRATGLSADGFYGRLNDHLGRKNNQEILIFIHGYNVSFNDAIYRTAQIAYDLDFDGAAVLYSWPSEGRLLGYLTDANNAEWTIPHLKTFLSDIIARANANVVHIVAHSMGTRPLVRALSELPPHGAESRPRVRQVVLAASDIDAAVFQQLAAGVRSRAERVTVYASSNDKALQASAQFQGYQRLGDTSPSVVQVDGIDTIDASAVDTNFLGHSYFGDVRTLLSDLYYLIKNGFEPDQRDGLEQRGTSNGRYWAFRP